MRPTSLDRFRVNSPRPAYEANVHNINEDSIDCGVKVLKCCNTPFCRRMATMTWFLTVLVFIAITQGICEKYIIVSAQQAALEHDYDPKIVEWLLVSHGIIQLFALAIAYWGNRIHKITWLCGMLVFEAVTAFIVIIPTIAHDLPSQSTINIHNVNLLCMSHTSASYTFAEYFPHSITTLVGLFILQLGISYGFIAFYTLGLTYLDDNSIEHNGPALIGAALAGKYFGHLLGNGLPLIVNLTSLGWWFGWALIAPTLFFWAVMVGLFPRRLLATVIRQAADTIVETATNSSQISLSRTKFLSDTSFWSSFKRLFSNKILLLNIFATVFIETAMINFILQNSNYLQSRFLLPADDSNLLHNEWTSRLVSKFVQPFVVGLAVLVGGLIIAKATPSARKIVSWNLITALIVCVLFVAFIFIECKHNSIAGAYGNKLFTPFCSRSCVCDPDIRFTPVCPENGVQTFYSPCHAGCTADRIANGQRVFTNCSCGIDSELALINDGVSFATEGACGYIDCQKLWIIFQFLFGFATVCMGSRLVGKILISIRSVLNQDKAIALGLELMVVGIITYIPGKLGYDFIADMTCQYWSQNKSFCYLQDSKEFGNYVNILSAILSAIAAIFEFIILFLVKDLELYGDQMTSEVATHPIAVEMQPISSDERDAGTEEESNRLLRPSDIEHPHLSTSVPSERPANEAAAVTTQAPTESPKPSSSSNVRFMQTSAKTMEMSSSRSSSYKYSPVYKKLPETHVEELNLRLQSLNKRIQINLTENGQGTNQPHSTFVKDINPSVGDVPSDSDINDINIRQLESSLSSLSGLPTGSSTVNSPEIARSLRADRPAPKWHVEARETNF